MPTGGEHYRSGTSRIDKVKAAAREIGLVGGATLLAVLGLNIAKTFFSAGSGMGEVHLKKRSAQLPIAAVGAPLSILRVALNGHPLSLVLVTSPNCPHCQASASFHGRVCDEASRHGVPMYVAVPEPAVAKEYLEASDLSRCTVVGWADLAFRVAGTPTLMAVNQQSRVGRIWIGRPMTDEGQEEILRVARGSAGPTPEEEALPDSPKAIPVDELNRLRQAGRAILLDVREREPFDQWHTNGATNIPLAELPVRAAFELDRAKLQVVDCTNLAKDQCKLGVMRLTKEGFDVRHVGAGALRLSCVFTPE
jgi:rhodanese-related sulfurtransferase